MVLTCSRDMKRMLDNKQREQLLDIACRSIAHGLASGEALEVDPAALDATLIHDGASFVTLHLNGQLRGCIGSLEAHRPLAIDVAENAWAAAFRDPRFAPLARHEQDALDIEISVLGKPERLAFDSEQDLIEQIRPGIDGLILKKGARRGTFLPSVWKSLPEAATFLQQLKLKAGLPVDYWSDDIEIWRYTTESFSA